MHVVDVNHFGDMCFIKKKQSERFWDSYSRSLHANGMQSSEVSRIVPSATRFTPNNICHQLKLLGGQANIKYLRVNTAP